MSEETNIHVLQDKTIRVFSRQLAIIVGTEEIQGSVPKVGPRETCQIYSLPDPSETCLTRIFISVKIPRGSVCTQISRIIIPEYQRETLGPTLGTVNTSGTELPNPQVRGLLGACGHGRSPKLHLLTPTLTELASYPSSPTHGKTSPQCLKG